MWLTISQVQDLKLPKYIWIDQWNQRTCKIKSTELALPSSTEAIRLQYHLITITDLRQGAHQGSTILWGLQRVEGTPQIHLLSVRTMHIIIYIYHTI